VTWCCCHHDHDRLLESHALENTVHGACGEGLEVNVRRVREGPEHPDGAYCDARQADPYEDGANIAMSASDRTNNRSQIASGICLPASGRPCCIL
jgi:hypothetical protein